MDCTSEDRSGLAAWRRLFVGPRRSVSIQEVSANNSDGPLEAAVAGAKGRAAKETAVSVLDVQQEAFLASLSALERRALAEMLNRVYTNQAEVHSPER